jgi:hypothetical protein
MSYRVNESKSYSNPQAAVYTAAQGAIEGIQGKIKKEDSQAGTIKAEIPKTIHGKTLGDRTHMQIHVHTATSGETAVDVVIYPVNAVGQELQFGARKGVANTVVGWFWAHLEHRL